jgi:hypothetical protein
VTTATLDPCLELRRTVDDLQAQVAELQTAVAELQGRTSRRPLTTRDINRLRRWLPAIGGAMGSAWWTSRELLSSGAPAVQVALDGVDPRELGLLLRRAAGVPVGGLVIERAGKTHNAVQWRVQEVVA